MSAVFTTAFIASGDDHEAIGKNIINLVHFLCLAGPNLILKGVIQDVENENAMF